MKINKHTASCLMVLLFAVTVAGQTPAQMLAYLKKNISIYYIARPNTTDPDIREIKTSSITLAAKGIIFGKTDNNGMDISAQLLTGLFNEIDVDPKTSILKGKDGDSRLQEMVYYALQIAGKPVSLFFINDKHGDGVEPKYWSQYSLYTIHGFDGYYVWSGAFPGNSASYAGNIVLGEFLNRDLQKYKEEFIGLITRLALGGYGTAKRPSILDIELKKNPPTRYLPFTFAVHDIRQIANQAIGNAFAFYYSQTLKEAVDRWVAKGGYIFLPKPGFSSSEPLSVEEKIDVPAEYRLQTRMLSLGSNNTGYAKETFAPDISSFIMDIWSIYSDFYMRAKFGPDVVVKYINLSDFHLGILCYGYIQKLGLKKFAECMRLNKNKWLAATPDQKIAMIVNNICSAL